LNFCTGAVFVVTTSFFVLVGFTSVISTSIGLVISLAICCGIVFIAEEEHQKYLQKRGQNTC